MWEQFTQWLTNVTNNPAFIAVASVVSSISGVLLIVSRTSLGKKALKKMFNLTTKIEGDFDSHKKVVEDKLKESEELINKKLSELAEVKDSVIEASKELDKQVKIYFNQFNFYEEQMFAILELIPNAKVQEKVSEFKAEWEDKKKEIEEFLCISYEEFEAKAQEFEDEKNKQIAELQKQLDEIKELVFGESKDEERIDSEAKEE